MRVKPQDFKFSVLIAAGYVNSEAEARFAPSASGFSFRWEREGKVYELHIEQEKLQHPDFILERLFDAAIEMTKE